MQEEFKEQEIQTIANNQRFEQELVAKDQKNELLERSLKETKESLDKIQSNSALTLKQTMATFDNERKTFAEKIEAQNADISNKDIENFQMKQSQENLKSVADRKVKESEKQIEDLRRNEEELRKSNEKFQSENQKLSEELMHSKNSQTKDLALANQKNEFFQKRMNELQSNVDSNQALYEDRLNNQKEDIQNEIKDTLERVRQERDQLETRYEAKKKYMKEMEAEYMNRISDQEKQSAVMQEKLINIEAKKLELEKKLANDSTSSHEQLKKNKELYANEKQNQTSELEKLKVKSYEQEQELVEAQANYDKDMALWQGKVQFLEQQREQIKNELNESQNRFEIMVQKFQQYRTADKEEAESSQNALMGRLEQRYQNQISELKEQQRQTMQENEELSKKQAKELKKLKDQISEMENSSSGNNQQQEKKLKESQENEKRMQDEVLLLKKDRENNVLEVQRKMDQEREGLRMRIFEMEQNLKESENKRQMFIFELEKEKTRWNIEKDRQISKQNEFLEQIDKLEKKKELLTRDNDKLTNDLKASKKGNQNSLINIMGMGLSKKTDLFNTERSFASKGGIDKDKNNLFDNEYKM